MGIILIILPIIGCSGFGVNWNVWIQQTFYECLKIIHTNYILHIYMWLHGKSSIIKIEMKGQT